MDLTNRSGLSWEVNSTLVLASVMSDMDYGDEGYRETSLSDIMGVWVTGGVCLLGLTGNVLSFIVLLLTFAHSPMFYVLRAVAVSDTVFLLCVLLIQTLVNLYPTTGLLRNCLMYRGYIQVAAWPVLMMTQMSTVWLTVLVSIERYIAVCFPLVAASYCTLPKVRRAVCTIFVVSVLYNIPRYFEFEVVANTDMQKTEVGSHPVYRYLYSCILYSLALFLLPLGLLIFLNGKLVLALNHGKKQWKNLHVRQRKEQNLTYIPLTIVLVFFICGTPALVVNVVDSVYPPIYNAHPSFLTFMVVANFLVVLNSACNFVIYCLLGKTFRTKLLEVFHCNCRPSVTYRAVHSFGNNRGSTSFQSKSTIVAKESVPLEQNTRQQV